MRSNSRYSTITICILAAFLIATCSADFIQDCLDGHNIFRTRLGLNSFTWSNNLASRSQQWANHMAANNVFMHGNQDGVGENIAYRTTDIYDGPKSMIVDQWGGEQRFYIRNCVFPDCSNSGNWDDVSHYTQMIWRDTTQVGCAVAIGFGNAYLCCQYLKPGNWDGQPCY